MYSNRILIILSICLSFQTFASAQQSIPDSLNGVVYRGNDATIARGVIDGNLIETNFRNHGELSRWNDLPWGVWPRGIGGRHIDGVGVVVSAFVDGVYGVNAQTIEQYQDRIQDQRFSPDTLLNPVSIHYRQAGLRVSPYNGDFWGWLPLPGFNNPLRTDPILGASAPVPALSNDPDSWPDFWPDRLSEEASGWPGTWNGRDGRFASADLESYYVMDDFSDLEYNVGIETDGPHSPFGVFMPDPINDPEMGGLGLQTQIRLFQWANILAEDAMFIIYRITNKGAYDHDRLYFSQIVDYGLGFEENDDNATFDDLLDVVYGWDSDGVGEPTQAGDSPYDLGYTGFAFLESPANDNNGIDDDQDGIIDESRFDSDYIIVEGASNIEQFAGGIYDVLAFEEYYGSPIADRPATRAGIWFTTDENLDWVGFTDDNGNGTHDPGEALNNDVGRDGLGPFDEAYEGPDEGEGDGLPTNGEPNYNELDVDESDQIGLTGFDLNTRPFYESGDNLRDDTWLFERIQENLFSNPDYVAPDPVANDEPFVLFTSGEVELFSEDDPTAKSTDFFSTAWLFGNDELDFFKNRRTVQSIYNSDYNFAQPPITPTLTAIGGDGQVLLSWDTLSIGSFDRFLQDFDFEGYKLYKGTDNILSDARTITDVNGTPTFYKPIVQYDLENGIRGTIPVLDGEAVYNLGSDSGLKFFHVDNDVTNGKTYYYALVAYDRGISAPGNSNDPGIDPQENTFRIALDIAGRVTGTSANAAAVTPQPLPAGYVSSGSSVDLSRVTEGTGTGFASLNIIAEPNLDPDKAYEVRFFSEKANTGDFRVTTQYEVRELTSGSVVIGASNYEPTTKVVDGFTISFTNDDGGEIILTRTGYVSNEGTENEVFSLDPSTLDGFSTDWEVEVTPELDLSTQALFEVTDNDYALEFVDPIDSLYTPPRFLGGGFSRINVPVFAKNTTNGTRADMLIRDNDDNDALSPGDVLLIVEQPRRGVYKAKFAVRILSGGTTDPSPGDKIVISTTRAFGDGDLFQFGITKGGIDNDLAAQQLEDIYVVPNPYIGAASWERAANAIGRGERRIQFMSVPQVCTIRIFNVRGELIRKLEQSGSFNNGALAWDLKTDNNEDVAYGVYFYHVEAPGIGEHTGKFAIIK